MDLRKMEAFDVVIVGGGTAGVPAAIAAARQGAKTLLVEKRNSLGGLFATGMPAGGFLDRALNHVVGGIPQELVDELQAMGQSFGNLRCPMHNSITSANGFWYKIIAARKCQEAGVEILLNADVVDVNVVSGRINSIIVVSGSVQFEIPCKVVIDATGDGVAAYLAGAKYEMGQPESLEELTVSVAKQEKRYDIGSSKAGKVQPVSILFNLGGVDTAEFKAYIKEHPETYKSPAGYGMEYDLDYLFNQQGIYFTGFGEFIEEARKNEDFDIPRDRVIFATLPGEGEYMINATRVVDVDPTDPVAMSKAELECQRQVGMLAKFFKKYCPGFKNSYISSVASYTAARESRRFVGLKTVRKADIDALSIPEDTIALCGYNVDIHLSGVGLYFQPADHAVGVPYGALVSENIDGLLLAGRCISCDSYALGILRSMASCLAEGEAAGTAAALAVKKEISVSEVDVDELRAVLVKNGAILSI